MKAKFCVVAVTALALWGLKRHYADADVDDLTWILTPTSRLVGAMSGTAFVAVPSEGYVSHERLFVIEKSCAGINFLVAGFGMLVFALFHRVRSVASGVRVLGVSLLASYGAALVANAVRITIAMSLADRQASLSGFSADQVHRLAGIVVYFAGLLLLFEIVPRVARRWAPEESRS